MTERSPVSMANVEHNSEDTNHGCDEVENMLLLQSLHALRPTALDDAMGASDIIFLPLPTVEQRLQCSSDTSSSTNNHKRLRDNVELVVDAEGQDYDYNASVSSGKDQDISAPSTTSSSSSSSHQENYQHNGSMDESDYSSDQEGDGSAFAGPEATSKTSKRARTGSLAGPIRSSESDSTRRTQSPACRYDLVRIALLRFRELFGNACVKRGFVVPDGSPDWPAETWGIRLDLAVRKIREGNTYADHLEDLRSLGFSFESRRAGYGFNTLRDGVLKYHEIHGDMNITRGFVVPKDSPLWPASMWGVHLGSCLRDIKRGKCYADRKEELRAIGYNFVINGRSSGKKYDFTRIKAAFETYKRIHGDLLVQAKYVVPVNDDAWPRETWGIKLGTYTQLIRMGKYGEDRKAELLELGFLFDNQRAKYGFDLVKTALVRYKEIHGNFLVKQKFLIPSGDAAAAAQWPERTWGIKLGNVLHDIRQGDSYRNKKQELEELGITFYTHKQPRGRQGSGSGSNSELRASMPLSGSAASILPSLGPTSSEEAESLLLIPAPTDASVLVQSSSGSSSSSHDTGMESVSVGTTQYCSEETTVSHV